VRKLLTGAALLLLSLPINQLAAILDIKYGLIAAGLAIAIGYGLLVTSEPLRKVWREGRRHMEITIIVSGLITGLMGAGAAWLLMRQEEYRATRQPPSLFPQAQVAPSVGPMKRELVDKIRHQLGLGEALRASYYRNIGTADLPTAITNIEQWRTDVGDMLNAPPLRNSGATEYVLTLGGDRITEPLQRVGEVLANLDKWLAQGSSAAVKKDVAGLVRLRKDGVALRNRSIRNDVEWTKFHREFEQWDKDTLTEMRNIGVRQSDVAWFEILDIVPSLEFQHAYNDPHRKDLRELSEKLRRLLEVTQRHEQN